MMPTARQTKTLLLALTLLPIAAIANEGLEPPVAHPLCLQEPAKKEIKNERVHKNWPDGSIKYKTVYFMDGTYVFYQFHENGQMKLESHHSVIPIDGKPRSKQHVKHGTEKRWSENGQLFGCAVHHESKKVGTWIYYRDDGTPAASFTYENDKEVEHLTFSSVFGWQPFKK